MIFDWDIQVVPPFKWSLSNVTCKTDQVRTDDPLSEGDVNQLCFSNDNTIIILRYRNEILNIASFILSARLEPMLF